MSDYRNGFTTPIICGYAVLWDVPYQHSDQIEMFTHDGFDAELSSRSIAALVMHDRQQEIGSTYDGTLKLVADDIGLQTWISLPATRFGLSIADRVSNGELHGLSLCAHGDFVGTGSGCGRYVERMRPRGVAEVSLVDRPANPATVAFLADDWKRHYPMNPDPNGWRAELKRLQDRGWNSTPDMLTAARIARKLGSLRLAMLAAKNCQSGSGELKLITSL